MKKTLAAILTGLILSAPVAAQGIDTISFGVDGGYPPFDVLSPVAKSPALISILQMPCVKTCMRSVYSLNNPLKV